MGRQTEIETNKLHILYPPCNPLVLEPDFHLNKNKRNKERHRNRMIEKETDRQRKRERERQTERERDTNIPYPPFDPTALEPFFQLKK